MLQNNSDLKKLCIVIGDPISASLSPLMHSAAYNAIGIEEDFAFLPMLVPISQLEDAVRGIRALGIRGTSCTMPHKERILPLLDLSLIHI